MIAAGMAVAHRRARSVGEVCGRERPDRVSTHTARFRRALLAHAAAANIPATVLSSEARDWASATFTGARCTVRLRADAPAAWVAALSEADFPVLGQLVADVVARPAEPGVMEVEALLLDPD